MHKKIIIVAGEESGDYHAATFVQALKSQHPDWEFSGIGGSHLQHAGMKLLFNLSVYGVTGITEVFRYFFIIKNAFNQIVNHVKVQAPDLVILVDYPGFNLRLAEKIRKYSQAPIIYYISPQIWAWKPKRLEKIKQYVDHMAVILPFEKKLYQDAGIPVTYVGHPIVKQLEKKKQQVLDKSSLELPEDKKLVAFLPGSRRNEVKRLLPIFIQTIRRLVKEDAQLHFVMPIAKSLSYDWVAALIPKDISISLIYGHAIDVMLLSEAVVVASGTASLECALLNRPSCLVYKISPATYSAATQLIQIPYIGLANILFGKMIMPEFIQDDCQSQNLATIIPKLVYDQTFRDKQSAYYTELYENLSATSADTSIEELISQQLTDSQADAVDKNIEKT